MLVVHTTLRWSRGRFVFLVGFFYRVEIKVLMLSRQEVRVLLSCVIYIYREVGHRPLLENGERGRVFSNILTFIMRAKVTIEQGRSDREIGYKFRSSRLVNGGRVINFDLMF